MKKIGAGSILLTMLLGLLTWAGATIVKHGERISTLEAETKSSKEHLIYIRTRVDRIHEKLDK